jgi:hypothetical protein
MTGTPIPPSHPEAAQLERLRRAVAPSRGVVIKRILILTLLAVCVYVLGPSVLATLNAWPQVEQISWLWLIGMAAAQIAANASLIWLQSMAMRSKEWFAIITAELAGGAVSRALPGGGAAAAGMQYSMLVRAGVPAGSVASGLTAASLLTLATVFVLPVVSVPVLIAGGTVPNGLADAAWLGLAIFTVMVALGWWVLGSDRPLVAAGHAVERTMARVRPKRPLHGGLPERLIAERDALVRALGSQALYAIIASLGRWLFDYLTLLAALTAVGANPNLADARRRPDHPGRSGHRRSRPRGDPRARRHRGRRCRCGDVRLSAVLLLAADADRARRVDHVPATVSPKRTCR